MDGLRLPVGQLLGSGYGQGLLGAYGAGLPNGMQGTDVLNQVQQNIPQLQQAIPGMNMDMMNSARMMPNQYPGSGQEIADKVAAADQAKGQMDAYKMMAQGVQGMGRNMQMQMPSGNTAQIMRDQNQFRFAGTPQQQMAQALRRR